MPWKDWIDELKRYDLNELDINNIGAWPVLVRGAVWLLAFILVLAGAYFYLIADLRLNLAQAHEKEYQLKQDFERKAFKAAKLDPLKKQMQEMEQSFGILLGQLPADTEVPGLLEDITEKAVSNGLAINSIKLQAETAKEFYIELPIAIKVSGSYHDLAAFVSGIASLPRIVTLHNYTIEGKKGSEQLNMDILAKTYRYKDSEGGK
ncbi:type 4a pilus biogenesis protein PilO [Spongiibacter sp. KMU-158]|uniref:Type 4a pilus biogenesis protein PilO n=1 Tax=Spongiibacter pelagi TaxID=2760804 RepID=A0A927GVK4_9GAMM|nr:type 4a pilus biogenesis protein PilO [Spongiibacter pelagi]MBD2857972.1 type 4a pilus biogenesis protein PilO [Spongiibacter pelagi]